MMRFRRASLRACLVVIGWCGLASSWVLTVHSPMGISQRIKTSPSRRSFAIQTVLQSERGSPTERDGVDGLFFLNSTGFVQDMDQQLMDLMAHQGKLPSAPPQTSEVIPPYEFNFPQIAKSQSTSLLQQDSQEKDEEGLSDLWKARLLLVGAAALYGTNFSLVKLLGDTMPVGVSSSLRFGLAALVTLPWLLKDLRNQEGALMAAWLGFEVGLWNSIGYISQAVGLDSTPAAESAFICSLAVVTVPILDFLSGKRLMSRQWIGALLAVVGVAVLELGGDMGSRAVSGGDLLTLVQPFAFGLGFWKMEKAIRRFPDQASRMTASQLLAVFLASTVYGLGAIDMPTLQSFPWAEWLTSTTLLFSLFWTGLVTTAMTIYMENKAMETLSAAETTLIFSTEPLWGTAFAGAVMGEQLGPNVALGAIFILSACLYSNLGLDGLRNLIGGTSAPAKDIQQMQLQLGDTVSFQRQRTWFSSSAATSWAWWRVAASNLPRLDNVTDVLEDTVKVLVEKL